MIQLVHALSNHQSFDVKLIEEMRTNLPLSSLLPILFCLGCSTVPSRIPFDGYSAEGFALVEKCQVPACAISRTGDADPLLYGGSFKHLELREILVEVHQYGGRAFAEPESNVVILTRRRSSMEVVDSLCIRTSFGLGGGIYLPEQQPKEDLMLLGYSDGDDGHTVIVDSKGELHPFRGDLFHIDSSRDRLALLVYQTPCDSSTEGIYVNLCHYLRRVPLSPGRGSLMIDAKPHALPQ
jgi:hypothetical protein